MKKRTSGSLLFSSLVYLLLASVMLTGQLSNYKLSTVSYSEIVQQNEAQTMKNMASAAKLNEQESLKFNLGKVTRDKTKWTVVLNNSKKFTYAVEQ